MLTPLCPTLLHHDRFPGYQVTSVSTNKKEGYCTGLPTVDQAAMHFLVPACLGAGCPTVTCADNVNSCGATCAENVPCDVSGVGGVCGSDNICRTGEHDCTGGALNTACAACAADPLTQSTSCLASDGAGTCDGDKCMASKDCSNSKLGTKCRMCGGTKASCTANDGPGFCQVQGNICQGKVAGCQYTLGKVGERCDVDYDPGYTGGGAVCLANDASGGTWDGGVTEATLIDRFCAADSAKCKDDGPGGKINCAVHKPLDLSLFEEVDCDTFTSLGETCTTTPAYGFSGGAVKCAGTKKYEVTTEPTKLDGYCTSASTKTGDDHTNAGEVFFTVTSFPSSKIGDTAPIVFTAGYGRGSVTCVRGDTGAAGAGVWLVEKGLTTPCYVSKNTIGNALKASTTIASHYCWGVTANGAECQVTMKPGFQDGSITCNTGDGRFDLVEGIPIPTSQPTALPTNQPTLAPTPQPTSLPTLAVETLVVVKSGMSFTPASGGAAEMDTPETRAAIAAQMEAAYLANGLLITIPLDSITFADTGGRRLGEPEETDAQGRRRLTGVAVEFDLQVSSGLTLALVDQQTQNAKRRR